MERRLYRVCRAMRLTDTDAQDAIQEALLNAYKSIDTLREEKYFETWLIRILINEARAIMRRPQRQDQPLNEKIPFIPEGENSVAAAILSLPEKERLCLTLHAIEGFSVKEIAEITKSPVGTVKWRLKKARDRLKETLEKERAI
ncbi:MAG: RNA polymerase sigma factor [Clostridia bacterium]|nr:RNA polymerase sigma factor [Clostridia bacterium]